MAVWRGGWVEWVDDGEVKREEEEEGRREKEAWDKEKEEEKGVEGE